MFHSFCFEMNAGNAFLDVFIPRLKLALGILTSVEQLVPCLRHPGFLEVPRGLGSLPASMY